MPEITEVVDIKDDDVPAVVALWQKCGLLRPWNDPHGDIAFARQSENATVLVGHANGAVVATAMTGHDGHRGAVYYVAVDPDQRRSGLGGEIVAAAEAWLRTKGVWKLNLLVRDTNTPVIGFYEALGYTRGQVIELERWLDPDRDPKNA